MAGRARTGGGTGLDAALAWWASVDHAPPGELWLPPRVALVTGPDGQPAVAWWPWSADPDRDGAWRRRPPDRRLLPAFLRLASLDGEAAAEAAVAFCRQYGPLGLVAGRDGHRPLVGLAHPSFWTAPQVLAQAQSALPLREPVAAYVDLAQRMAALLRVLAACAMPGTPGERVRRLTALQADLSAIAAALADLVAAGEAGPPCGAGEYGGSVEGADERDVGLVVAALAAQPAAAEQAALLVLADLLDRARPGLGVRLRPAPWEWEEDPAGRGDPGGLWPTGLTVWPVGAFAVLVVQLAAAVTALPQQALCDGCGAVYAPRRRPRAGEAHYCARCGREGGYRLSKRRWWARRQAQQGPRARQGDG